MSVLSREHDKDIKCFLIIQHALGGIAESLNAVKLHIVAG